MENKIKSSLELRAEGKLPEVKGIAGIAGPRVKTARPTYSWTQRNLPTRNNGGKW